MTLLDRVKALCKDRGISQGKMEREIGISNGASSKWKSSSPSLEILNKLSNYFGVSVDYLMNGEESNNSDKYYLNEETSQIAQEIFENPDMKMLFDTTRNCSPEDMKKVISMVKAFKGEL